jgi:hypothetical protein
MICRNSVLSFSKYSPFYLNYSSGRRGNEIRFASTRYLPSQDTVNEPKLPRFIRRQHLQEGSYKKHAQQTTGKTEISHSASTRYLPSQDTVSEPKPPRFIRRQHLQEGSYKKHAQQTTSKTEIRHSASTRYLSPQDTANEPKLPRFIRRQHLQEGSSKHGQQITSKTPSQSPSLSPRVPPTHRSRHYDPSNEEPKANMRLLEPHVLSKRLKNLCDSNKIDDAVGMLKNTPLDAQNTQVWNTLIWEALKAKRFQLSYQLFIDVGII